MVPSFGTGTGFWDKNIQGEDRSIKFLVTARSEGRRLKHKLVVDSGKYVSMIA